MAPDRSPSRTPLHAVLALSLLSACAGGGGGEPQAVCRNGAIEAGEACDDGNATAGDGCEPDCTVTAGAVFCGTLPAASGGTCDVTAGGASTLLRGTVLSPGAVYVGGAVAIDASGTIACVGCDCSPFAAGATVVTCAKGVISPGFVNAHDHLGFTQNGPVADTGERYEQRHDWRVGLRGHTRISVPGAASTAQMQWGELRFVLGGATSTVGGGAGAPGFLRNLDVPSLDEGLGAALVQAETFPLGDTSGTQLASGCAYPSIDTAASIAADASYVAHVAEGVDPVARNELVCLTSFAGGGEDLAQPQSAFVQGVGALAADYADLAASGTALVWSPRSNVRLYGDTAAVAEASRLGVQIALGTDWLATGSMNVLRELRCADAWNAERLGGHFSDEQLWSMATRNAAEVAGTGALLGALAAGRIADVAVFDGSAHPLHRAAIAAEPQDVVLLLRGGKALYGDAAVVAALAGSGCDALDVCGRAKQVCVESEIGVTLAALQASGGSVYPAFFCGPPVSEPTCTPSRPASVSGSTVYTGVPDASDADGDGVPDAADDCPSVFNPVRPLDGGVQADADGDGLGDACDPCPLAAGSVVCPAPDPADVDGDGVPNALDDCPALSNPSQADADGDGKGDACDACPADPNPGVAPCPVTIYAVKSGVVPLGASVALADALVTAATAGGFFLQVKPGDAGYAGSDFSGLWVSAPGNAVVPGDRVSVASATVTTFFGQLGLASASVVVTSSGEAAPAPVVVTPADVATGGPRAAALEGVLVQVGGVSVTDDAPPPGPGDVAPTNEFVVDGALRVDDLFYRATPLPAIGTTYLAITGVLAFRTGDSKLEPRSAADLVATSAPLTAFGPAGGSFARVGQVGATTIPDPLVVTLASAVATDTFVTVTSGDPASLRVVGAGVTIPAGQRSAPVLLDGLAQSAGVTLTATLGTTSLAAAVRVLDPTEQPTLVALEPATAALVAGAAAQLTVTLDIPAPIGADVTLSLSPAGAGTIPASVTVPADRLSATFTYSDGGTASAATVSATLGAVTLSSTLTMDPGSGLVLNEVDYDQPSTDTAEFIEIRNMSASPVSLAGIAVFLVNGATAPGGTVYATVDLSPAGTLPAGGYLVVAPPSLAVDPAALRVDFALPTDNIQNGAPDGIALVDTSTATLLDALSYEGSITAASLPPVGTVSLVEGAPTTAQDSAAVTQSLVRWPDGLDTDDAASDWSLSSSPTPGAANAL